METANLNKEKIAGKKIGVVFGQSRNLSQSLC